MKIMVSSPIASWQIDGEKMETVKDFNLLGSKITADSDCRCKIKGRLLLGRKVMANLDSVLKSRAITLTTKISSQSYVCYSSRVRMWGLDHKEDWAQRIDAFELWYLRRLLRVPWTTRRSNQSILKEIGSEYSLEGLMLKLKFQYFGNLMWRSNSLEKALVLGKVEERRRKGQQKMVLSDGIIDSVDMSLSKFRKIVKNRETWWSEVREVTKSQTRLSNWTTNDSFVFKF